MVVISVTVYTFTATNYNLRATISGLKFVAVGQNPAISGLLSGLKFKKLAKYRTYVQDRSC